MHRTVGNELFEPIEGGPWVCAVEPTDDHHRVFGGELVAGGPVGAGGREGPGEAVAALVEELDHGFTRCASVEQVAPAGRWTLRLAVGWDLAVGPGR